MFAKANGKCEYCGTDMILSFNIGHTTKDVPGNLATIDHKYNRDHELRGHVLGEKRLFLVCKKCNGDKSKTEPNKHEPNTVEKQVRKISPSELWSDEVFIEKLKETLTREKEWCREISKIDAQIKNMQEERKKLCERIGKSNSYRNDLIRIRKLQN